MTHFRRDFIKAAGVGAAAALSINMSGSPLFAVGNGKVQSSRARQNSVKLGDRMVAWQSPYGSTDLDRCPFRSAPGTPTIAVVQGIGPQVRALYTLYEATGDEKYKRAADRYAVFVLSTIHDPPTPLTNLIEINGKTYHTNSSAWVYGKSLSPCYEWFVANNPKEDLLNLKAHAIYRWLQRHRRDDSYFGVGYGAGEYKDSQFSCDLGEVGTGLIGFYKTTGTPEALTDAYGLAQYFLTDHVKGKANGIWSPDLGTWLVGPWPGGGAEHFTQQQYDQVGWGWSCLVVGEFLLELRKLTDDKELKSVIADHCLRAFQWCVNQCQFEDGAHGMFGRDDKWVGQTAAAILLYCKLREQDLVPPDVDKEYRPKIEKSWRWLLLHTDPETFPEGGYIKVTGATTTKPPENLMWMMSWTVEALLAGEKEFEHSS